MLLFEKEPVKKALHLDRFMDFINEIVPLYEEEIPLELIALLPWDELQKRLSEYISAGLGNLTDSAGQPPGAVFPKILKGVYFCLGDYFSIHGSLYYNEVDWAANAAYDYKDSSELFMQLWNELVSLQLDLKIILDLRYMFAVFTSLKTLRTIDGIKDIANAVMALGYSDGDILTLGYFSEQQFQEHIEIVDNGEYENPSTAPVEVPRPVVPRGDLWDYMRSYCMTFIQEQGLQERFWEFGGAEAERISHEFKEQLILNRCPLCHAIKKTPRARLCLKCGEFTPPVGT
ncbi:hypothetical protein ACD661_08225 [Legionella lytica]|uniref:Zinc ribbon domain-containing protein n=1 Tax=Legionella lytica TaxID=96232 RepID=A0ABW8D764_9GAMM